MKNKMSDLRNHLFEALEKLQDDEKPMELARAKAISDVAQTIINSAKVEVEYMEALGVRGSSEFHDALDLEADEPKRGRQLEGTRRVA